VKDLDSRIDFVNCFTESYGDPLGMKASWESIVNFKDMEATKRTEAISANAQWFETNSPVEDRFKKEEVKGVSAKVITGAIIGGDLYPATAIGINLPNSNWIRSAHGSKSVTIGNFTDAYNKAGRGSGFSQEFVIGSDEIKLLEQYGDLTGDLHTDLHECLGHGSGKLLPGVDPDALKAYGSTIEEARADLFGLYYLADDKLVELGLTPNNEAYKAQYYSYMMNGLMTQLVRIDLGNIIEEAHMRNRALVARWAMEKGAADKVVEFVKKDGETFVKVNDYKKLRDLFGQLLAEIQRIKSEGDFEAAREMVEKYAVQIDPTLHAEILDRYKKLNLAPYKGFINPVYTAITDAEGNITDVTIDYTEGYAEQMLRYSKEYGNLPYRN
jgi:dipeptidyl-peptidase-3